MSVILPELEVIDGGARSLRYLEHGWPDPLCRWHSHLECELHLILSTHGKAFVGDYIGDFGPQSLFLTGPNLPHNWITDEFLDEPVETRDMVIQFNQDKIEGLTASFPEFGAVKKLMERSQSGLEFFDFDFDWIKEQFAAIRDTHGPKRILIFLEMLARLSGLAQVKELSIAKLVQAEGNSNHAKIGQVIDHIVQNFAEDISIAKAADKAGMTEATFRRNFQATTGHRFVEFVNRVRVGQACALLYASDDQITSICYQVGYQNLANFNRHFLKMKGMTPSAYREMARADLIPTKEPA